MTQIFRSGIGILFSAVFISGCNSLLEEPMDRVQVLETTPTNMEPSTPSRSLGSLWSNGSSWNHLYSSSASRVAGDLVEIKVGNSLRDRIDGMYRAMAGDRLNEPPPMEGEDAEKAKAKAKAAKPEEKIDVPGMIQGIIREVNGKGIYRIEVSDSIRLGRDEPRIYLQGQVRDRDIDGEDRVSSDSIYGLRLQLKPARVASSEN